MFKASDGKQFAHEGMGKSYEGALQGGKGGLKPAEKESPESVVAAHGPAHTTHIVKDKASGKHSVHSMHDDGHKHSSHGHDVASAHEHSLALHGGSEEQSEQPESPELEASESEAPASMEA